MRKRNAGLAVVALSLLAAVSIAGRSKYEAADILFVDTTTVEAQAMKLSVYDADSNGVVDAAETVTPVCADLLFKGLSAVQETTTVVVDGTWYPLPFDLGEQSIVVDPLECWTLTGTDFVSLTYSCPDGLSRAFGFTMKSSLLGVSSEHFRPAFAIRNADTPVDGDQEGFLNMKTSIQAVLWKVLNHETYLTLVDGDQITFGLEGTLTAPGAVFYTGFSIRAYEDRAPVVTGAPLCWHRGGSQ